MDGWLLASMQAARLLRARAVVLAMAMALVTLCMHTSTGQKIGGRLALQVLSDHVVAHTGAR